MKPILIFGMFVMALIFAQITKAQTADEIVTKYIAARGGKDNITKIQNLVMEGSLTVQGAEIAVTITQVNNKLSRQDINAMGMHGFILLTDKEGWNYMPFQGMQKPEARTADEVKKSQADLDLAGPLVDYAAKGNKVELVGKEDVEGTECYKLKVTMANSKEVTYYIDPNTFLSIRKKEKIKANGQDIDMQVDYSDFKDVEGVKMPFSVSQQFGTIIFSSIKINQTIADSVYKHDI